MVRVRKLTYLIVASVLLSLFAMGVSAEDEVYLEPQNSTVRIGETVDVEIWANATGFQGGQINLTYNSSCVNITDWVNNSADFELGYWNSMTDGREWILSAANYSETEIPLTGKYKIGTLTIEGLSQGSTELKFSENSSIFNDYGNEITVEWINGRVEVDVEPQISTFELSLVDGWNLISIPLELSDTSLDTVFSGASDGDELYAYEDGAWVTATYYSALPGWYGDLTNVELDKGYWYRANTAYTVLLEGVDAGSRSVPIDTGWNLIGYARLSSANLDDLIPDASDGDELYAYDTGWVTATYYSALPGWYGDLGSMEPGKGYWYRANAPFTWDY